MKNTIDLDNNFYLKVITNNTDEDLDNVAIDITKLNLFTILKKGTLLLKINFNKIHKKQYKKILKRLLFIKNLLKITKVKIGILENDKKLIGYLFNYDDTNKDQNDFISAINAILYKTRFERYNYIYDTVCNYLDSYFYGKNLCDFHDNKCGEKRTTSSTTGCCHHFRIKWLGPLTKLVLCEYLKDDHTCGAKCISCKLFTCDYLERKNVKFRIKDILLLHVFFNPLQKYFIKYMTFTPKDKIIKRLMIT